VVTQRTAAQARQYNIEKMGETLGKQYSALWQEVASIYWRWGEYVLLFATNSERVAVLNKASPQFFRMIQDDLWDAVLLHIARLTDPPNSFRRKDKSNLTIQNLPNLIEDPSAKAKVTSLIELATKQSAFCRDWRNRHIAHAEASLSADALGQQKRENNSAAKTKYKTE
jgi:hypothetical protein